MYCLHYVLEQRKYQVVSLVTTLNCKYNRVSMHGIREELLEKQAASIGLPLEKMWVEEATNEEYEQQLKKTVIKFKEKGVRHILFGDIFLDDLKAYRDKLLEEIGVKGVYPLWKRDTTELITGFIKKGFKAITCCVSNEYLNEDHCGQEITPEFITSLPENADPCGENGEFHTFVYDGPLFTFPLEVEQGKIIYKELSLKSNSGKPLGFWYADLYTVS